MKNKIITAIALLMGGTAVYAQTQTDSVRIVIHQDINGTIHHLDTAVAHSQQQQLFQWMEQQGYELPAAPPPPPGEDPTIVMIVLDDSTITGPNNVRTHHLYHDSIAGPNGKKVMVITDGHPLPPPPPGGKVPPVPPCPSAPVKVEMIEKDTIINGQKHKMIVRTETIVIDEKAPLPPSPPKAPAKQSSPESGLTVFPNPTTSTIHVEFDVKAKSKTEISVTDASGKSIYAEQIVEDQDKHCVRDINVNGKAKGTYTVVVTDGKRKEVSKVVVQ
jgi:hypothetical protein